METIPTLSMKHFETEGYDKIRFIDTLGTALEHFGFFALEDHGIDPRVVDKAYQLAREFFHLPEATKHKYKIEGYRGQRGYTAFGMEHAKDSAYFDLKEFWHVGRLESQFGYLENIWPEEVQEFKQTMSTLYQQIEACTLTLLEACSIYIQEPNHHLRRIAEGGNSILRIIHYPQVPKEYQASHLRAAPHEDINLITLLVGATASGLEILTRDGSWLPIAAKKNQVIVDSGDMLQNLTNGLFQSTTHRVVNPDNDTQERYSMPFFCHAQSEASLAPLRSCLAKTGSIPKYRDISAGAYLTERLKEIGLS